MTRVNSTLMKVSPRLINQRRGFDLDSFLRGLINSQRAIKIKTARKDPRRIDASLPDSVNTASILRFLPFENCHLPDQGGGVEVSFQTISQNNVFHFLSRVYKHPEGTAF